MQKQTTTETFRVLNEIRSKGYIRPEGDNIPTHYKQITHALADFFKATPIELDDALECMEQLVGVCKNTGTFFSLFSKTMMDLYDWAVTGDTLTQRRAETKLLFFFSKTVPNSVEQKKRLLTQIQQMPDWQQRKREVGKVLVELTNNYDQNGQFNEDPGFGVLKSVSNLLRQIGTKTAIKHTIASDEKDYFRYCANLIQRHCPQLYEDLWSKKFSPSAPHKFSAPSLEEPVEIYTTNSHRSWNRNFSRAWDRE